MKEIQCIRYNEEFAKNISGELLNKLITFEGVIPDEINNAIRFNNPIYKTKRHGYIDNHMYIAQLMYVARTELKEVLEKEGVDEYIEYENNIIFKFVEDHPELKPLIDYIEFCDEDLNTIKEVPFDEYLNQYR